VMCSIRGRRAVVEPAADARCGAITDLHVTFRRNARRTCVRGYPSTSRPGDLGLVGDRDQARPSSGYHAGAARAGQDQGSVKVTGTDMVTATRKRCASPRSTSGHLPGPDDVADPTMRIGKQVVEAAAATRRHSSCSLRRHPGTQTPFRAYPHELSGGLRQR